MSFIVDQPMDSQGLVGTQTGRDWIFHPKACPAIDQPAVVVREGLVHLDLAASAASLTRWGDQLGDKASSKA